MEHGEFLKEIKVFAGLSDEELAEVSRSVEERTVPPGGVIVEEGTPGDSLYLIKRGRVRVEKRRGDTAVKLAELGPRMFFGEMALIDDAPHSACIVAEEECEILTINRLDLDIILNWNTVLGMRLWRTVAQVLAERLRSTNEKIFERMLTADSTQKFRMFGELIKPE
jgi:CRP/FNR family transcriptional regulator